MNVEEGGSDGKEVFGWWQWNYMQGVAALHEGGQGGQHKASGDDNMEMERVR